MPVPSAAAGANTTKTGTNARDRGEFRLWLPLPGLNPILPHGERSIDTVELEVEPTGVTDRLSLVVPSPEGRCCCPTVCAAETEAAGCGLRELKRHFIMPSIDILQGMGRHFVCYSMHGHRADVSVDLVSIQHQKTACNYMFPLLPQVKL
jgi:hypothetical protein